MFSSLSKPKPNFEKPTWPKLPDNIINAKQQEQVEQIKQEVPANVEGSKEFNQSNEESMKETNVENPKHSFEPIEPLKNNRFLITFQDVNVPQHFFRNYEMYNEGEEMIFTTEFLESVGYTFNPKDFFKINSVKLEYLDPVGDIVGGLTFNVKGSNFSKKGDYADDSIQTTQLRFVIDVNSINPLFEY